MNLSDAVKIYAGAVEVSKIYLGSQEVWTAEGGGLPLAGWDYRKEFTATRESGAVTDYQVKILVGESSGATNEDVDCGGHVLSTFNDLRFTKADGTTLLPYWIESITGTTPNQLATVVS